MSTHTTSNSAEAGKHLNQLTGHEYDGICEYDNPTPGWWHWLFGATIVFSLFYLVFWHGSVAGYTNEEAWEGEQRAEFVRVFGAVGQLKHDEATILAQTNNPQFMKIAQATFIGNCAACHARDGGGMVGVNLCDEYSKNVRSIEDIFKVISEGAGNGAMPGWKNRLSQNEQVILAAYVATLRGTTPASPKPPEGELMAPWPAVPSTVSPSSAAPGAGK